MLRLFTIAVLAIGSTTPVFAQFESMMLAHDLGTVLAAEEFCGLEYNQDAISAFIAEKAEADDMSFAGDLNMSVQGQKFMQQDMGKSEKTAHCSQIKRVAAAYGFVQ